MNQPYPFEVIFSARNICEILKYFSECVSTFDNDMDKIKNRIQEIVMQDKTLTREQTSKFRIQFVQSYAAGPVRVWNILCHANMEKVSVFLFHVEETVDMMQSRAGFIPDLFYLSPEITIKARDEIMVHQTYKSLYTPCSSFILKHSLDTSRFYVSGYSIAGCIASLAALDISLCLRQNTTELEVSMSKTSTLTHVYTPKERVNLITFGSPASGNATWGQLLVEATNGQYQRYFIVGDPVPDMSSWGLWHHVYCHSANGIPLAFDLQSQTFRQPLVRVENSETEFKESETTIIIQNSSEFHSWDTILLSSVSKMTHSPKLLAWAYKTEAHRGLVEISKILPHIIDLYFDSLK